MSKFESRFFGVVLDGYVEKKGQDCFYVSLLMPPVGQIPNTGSLVKYVSELLHRRLGKSSPYRSLEAEDAL